MQKQTTQKERMPARVAAGGGGTGLAVVVAYALGLLGLDPTPEVVAAISGLLVSVFGMVVSRLGK